jgi:protoporphyrinogen oxidase
MKKKVVIIGAGPAGLTAGYELLHKSKDYKVVVLEESNCIGGISRTVNYKGNRMDIGGHRFFSKDPEVMKFWNNILPLQGSPSFDDKKLDRKKNIAEEGPDPEVEDRVMLVRNRISRIYYLKKFFDYPISLKLQTFTNMGAGRTIKSGFSYLKSMVVKKKEDSLENFYINRFGKQLYSMFFEKYTEKLWGRHPSEISADWGSQRVKGLSIWAVIKDMLHISKKKETSLIEEYIYPKYGPGQLWETVASEITNKGGEVLLNHQVVKINVNNKKIESVVCNIGGKEKVIKGDIFISSMPLKDLVLDLDCKLPPKVKKVAQGLPYRDFVTIGLLVKKLNLKNTTKIKTLNNIVPDCWIYVQEPDVKLGRIQVFNNWSPYMVKKPEETVWVGLEYFCNEGDDFWNMTDKECIKFATEELIHMGIIDKEDVIDAHREKVKKAYPAYFDTYENIDDVIKYVNKFDNLYCVGRNGQHRYNNMDHSMITSFETVKNILSGEKSRENIWNVNTEKDYHESKASDDKKEK